jgi:hypothetical protein
VSEEGRQDIANDFEDTAELAKDVGKIVADGADYVYDEIQTIGNNLPEEYQARLGDTGEELIDELIQQDWSDEQIAGVLENPKVQDGLAAMEQSSSDLEEGTNNEQKLALNETVIFTTEIDGVLVLEPVVVSSSDGVGEEPSALETGVAGLGKVKQEIDTIRNENSELATGLEIAVGVATGGPLKEGIGQVANVVLENIYGSEVIDNVMTDVVNRIGGAVTGDSKEAFEQVANINKEFPDDSASVGYSLNDIRDGADFALGTILGIGGSKGGSTSVGVDGKSDSSGSNNKAQESSANRLEVGKIEPFGESKKTTGDGSVDREHNPPKQALQERAKQIKKEELSAAEKRRINNNSDTITLPRDVHQSATSSKGYNSNKAKSDASDLQSATKKYSDEHIENSKNTEFSSKIKTSCESMNCKTNKQYDEFLEQQLDRNKQ